jgi:hypothetical protein
LRSDIDRTLQKQMEALLEGSRSFGTRTTTCQVSSEVRPENSEAGPEEMEADMGTFKECSEEMDAPRLEVNPEETEVAVERRSSLRKRYTSTTSGHWRTDIENDVWLCDVAEGQRNGSETCWAPAEVIYLPQATDTPRRPCSVQGTCR